MLAIDCRGSKRGRTCAAQLIPFAPDAPGRAEVEWPFKTLAPFALGTPGEKGWDEGARVRYLPNVDASNQFSFCLPGCE